MNTLYIVKKWNLPEKLKVIRRFSAGSFKDNENLLNDRSLSFDDRLRWNQLNTIDRIEPITKFQRSKRRKNKDFKSDALSMKIYKGSNLFTPSVILSKRSNPGSYYINVPENTLQSFMNTTLKIHLCRKILFTSLNWRNIAGISQVIINSVLPQINKAKQLAAGQIYVYGPIGISMYMRTLIMKQFSNYLYEQIWPHLVFVELDNGSVIDDGCLYAKAFELFPNGSKSRKYNNSTIIYEMDFKNDAEMEDLVEEDLKTELCKDLNDKEHRLKIVVVDCPTSNHADALLKRNFVNCFNDEDQKKILIHLTPLEIFNDEKYQKWMNRIAKYNIQHVAADNTSSTNRMHPISGLIRSAFNKGAPEFFPLYQQKNLLDDNKMKDSEIKALSDKDHYLNLEFSKYGLKEYNGLMKFTSRFKKFIECLPENETNEYVEDIKMLHPKFIVLGCNSSSLYTRNPSCYLFRLNENKSILMDCGMGSLQQIYNHFGPSKFTEILSTIKLVFISHKHTDHISGLISVIEHLLKVNIDSNKKVAIVAPRRVLYFIGEYVKLSHLVNKFDLYDLNQIENLDFRKVTNLLGLKRFTPVRVEHGPLTYGLVVSTNKWKLVYSADTLPMSKELIKEGKNADLLIHECTFMDFGTEFEAKQKQHSNIEGTLATAEAMQAKNTLLTHFNSRVPSLPLPHYDKSLIQSNYFYAADHMEICFSRLKYLPEIHNQLYPIFKSILANHEKRQDKRHQRNLRTNERFKSTLEAILANK